VISTEFCPTAAVQICKKSGAHETSLLLFSLVSLETVR
jgi:hypothetical protein